MYRNPAIIHISDLHFGRSNHNPEASEKLSKALGGTFPLPDFLVVTGDLTQWGTREEMEKAKCYLLRVLDNLWRDHAHAARCIVVPGNHDLLATAWKALFWRKRLKDFNAVFGCWGLTGGRVAQEAAETVKPATLKDFYLEEETSRAGPNADKSKIESDAEQRAQEALRVCEYFPKFQTAFIKINSSVKRVWLPWNLAKGYAGEKQLSRMEKVLDDYAKAFPATVGTAGFPDAQLIALLHHHVAHLRHAGYEEKMLMTDAGNVWQCMCRLGCLLILHGHRHRAAQLGMSFWDAGGKERGTNVLAAGTASGRDTDDGFNSYYRIYVGCLRTEVSMPKFQEGDFTGPGNSRRISFTHPFELALDEELKEELEADAPLYTEPLRDSLLTDEDTPDLNHRYDSIDFTGVIDDSLNYHGCYVLRGTNVSGQPTLNLPFSLTAAGSHSFEDLCVKATDLVLEKSMAGIEVTQIRPINAFPIRIPFIDPVPDGGSFRIRICFTLPRVMLEQYDYDMINLVRFRLGVGKISHQLFATKEISEPVSLAIWGKKVARTRLVPEPVEGDFGTLVPGASTNTTVKGYRVEMVEPDAISYLLYYRRLL